MVVVLMSPRFSLGQHEFLRVPEGRERSLALDEVAGLTGGHKIVHASAATSSVGVNMINRQDQPILEVA